MGTVGWVDETSVAKKGDKTPGVQRQYCGAGGKIDNCVVTVHLACRCGDFMALLDQDLFLPEKTWGADRGRCKAAHVPDDVTYRSKWEIALGQLRRAAGNGVRFDRLTFDEWYGGKPGFVAGLEGLGLLYVCEVPRNLPCFSTYPRYKSLQKPYQPKRADSIGVRGKSFQGKPWKRVYLSRGGNSSCCSPPSRPTGCGGKNPEVTIEQRTRALNTLCRAWLQRRSKQPRVEHVASVIQYHQARNKAARQSRQGYSPKRE